MGREADEEKKALLKRQNVLFDDRVQEISSIDKLIEGNETSEKDPGGTGRDGYLPWQRDEKCPG